VAVWDPFLTPRDRELFASSGHGRQAGFGKRPVVMVIDVNYFFCGDRREPILESVKRWRNSCGEEAWDAADRIADLLGVARAQGIPVIYSTGVDRRPDGWGRGRWGEKNARSASDPKAVEAVAFGNTILPAIQPLPQDIVIKKAKPSVFFGTLLNAYLVDLQVDTIIATGGVTSGCVRSTVLDAFSYNYRSAVVEDCTFDRGEASHAIGLFDLDSKYADVIKLDDACRYLSGLPAGLFDEQMPSLREARRSAAVGEAGTALR
jgi:nicotinamidase-related amidase